MHHVAYDVSRIIEPKTMQEALASDHAKDWKAAADSELGSPMAK